MLDLVQPCVTACIQRCRIVLGNALWLFEAKYPLPHLQNFLVSENKTRNFPKAVYARNIENYVSYYFAAVSVAMHLFVGRGDS